MSERDRPGSTLGSGARAATGRGLRGRSDERTTDVLLEQCGGRPERKAPEGLSPITPGELTDIPGWQISHRFEKGHRIRLTHVGFLLEFAPSGTVTVASRNHGSYLELPVRAAKP